MKGQECEGTGGEDDLGLGLGLGQWSGRVRARRVASVSGRVGRTGQLAASLESTSFCVRPWATGRPQIMCYVGSWVCLAHGYVEVKSESLLKVAT